MKFFRNKTSLLIIFMLFVVVGLGTILFFNSNFMKSPQKTSSTLGQSISVAPTNKPVKVSPTLLPTYTPVPIVKLSKKKYVIAAFGDSMIDTMGDDLPYLKTALSEKYPGVAFALYNYGIGAQNITDGLARFASPYVYQARSYPPITQIGADVIILGTFAYNPFPSHDRNRHYLEYTKLVQQAKQTSSAIYIIVEIAPLGNTFGKGKNGINWPPDLARTQALHIIEQLENGISVGKAMGVPIIDTYHMTQFSGQFGEASYVNPDDGIHPSVAGHTFIAEQIAEQIKFH